MHVICGYGTTGTHNDSTHNDGRRNELGTPGLYQAHSFVRENMTTPVNGWTSTHTWACTSTLDRGQADRYVVRRVSKYSNDYVIFNTIKAFVLNTVIDTFVLFSSLATPRVGKIPP
jgi:hypothetical protein